MKLEKIITLANANVRLRFLAMERSLRATGCNLPLWVIPYDGTRFDLPANAIWWEIPEIKGLLAANRSHPMMAKYQCFTTENYQYVDSDVIFLRNPETVLAEHDGFITSCGHWGNPDHTYTETSLAVLKSISTCWQTRVFNAGQWACDRVLYSFEGIRSRCCDPQYIDTCLKFPFHDQPGTVLLVNLSGVSIYNLTLPPVCMESTWAGSYRDENYVAYWKDEFRKPYLLHWAGCSLADLPINRLLTDYFTDEERRLWDQEIAQKRNQFARDQRSFKNRLGKLLRGFRAFQAELQPKESSVLSHK
jgi:hypothetical protein